MSLAVIPNGEGYGMETTAGAGATRGNSTTVIKVTNLNASGAGSFKAAVEASGARTVVFEVSGTIQQDARIRITNPYLTIAGATAPTSGINLRGLTVWIETHDILIQHVRLRIGDLGGHTPTSQRDGFNFNAESDIYNVVLDHCSIAWQLDGGIDFYAGSNSIYDISVRSCIIAEGLLPTESGSNMLGDTTNVSFIGNLFAHNMGRNPRLAESAKAIIVNNVIYNSMYDCINFSSTTAAFRSSAVGNVIVKGFNSTSGADYVAIVNSSVHADAEIYVEDNICDISPQTEDWDCVQDLNGDVNQVFVKVPTFPSPLTIRPANETLAWVLASAGARPINRDAVDTRLVKDVQDITGIQIQSQSEVGGWESLSEDTRTLTVPTNKDVVQPSGYTKLEEWLHVYANGVENENPASEIKNAGGGGGSSIIADVSPDDNNNLPNAGILYVGGAGNIKVDGMNGGTVTFISVPAGKWLDRVRFKKVYLTGTTATGILVAYR